MGWKAKDGKFYEDPYDAARADNLWNQKERLIAEQKRANDLMAQQNKMLSNSLNNTYSNSNTNYNNYSNYSSNSYNPNTAKFDETFSGYGSLMGGLTSGFIHTAKAVFNTDLRKVTKREAKEYIVSQFFKMITRLVVMYLAVKIRMLLIPDFTFDTVIPSGHFDPELFIVWIVSWILPGFFILLAGGAMVVAGITCLRLVMMYDKLPEKIEEKSEKENKLKEDEDDIIEIKEKQEISKKPEEPKEDYSNLFRTDK